MPSKEEKIKDIIEGGPKPGDGKATQWLSDLFGPEWWKILWSGEPVKGDASLIISLLQVFNTVMLAGVALILLYVAGHAFVGSAHEGAPLGRRLHSVWVPIRSVLSISFLSPIPWAPSLNFIQGIVLAFIGFSIQFANMATTQALDFIQENHGQVVTAPPSGVEQTGYKIAQTALHNYMIQYHQYRFQEKSSLVAGYDTIVKGPHETVKKGKSNVLDQSGSMQGYDYIVYKFLPPPPLYKDAMGAVKVKCKELGSSFCKARQKAAKDLMSEMESIAQQKISELAGGSGSVPDDAVVSAVNNYGHDLMSHISVLLDEENTELDEQIGKFVEQVNEQGFVMLGSYFWTMSRFQMSLRDQVNAETETTDYNKEKLKEQTSSRFNQILTNLEAGNALLDEVSTEEDMDKAQEVAELGGGSLREKAKEDPSAVDAYERIRDTLADFAFTDWVDRFMWSISSVDPISNLAAWGHGIMSAVYTTILPLLSTIHALPYVGKVALPYILFIVPPLFMLGITLAYYLPAVPFFIWVSAVFGWLIMVVEAFVAAPLWAVLHASPDGEGIAGQAGSQGYIIFLQVLLRPVLMVIGFFFALALVALVGQVGELFTIFFHGLSENEYFAGPITAIVGCFLGGTVIIILTHKAFGLIYWLSESVLRWIGARGAASMGEEKDSSQSHSMIVGAVGAKGTSAGGGAIGRAEKEASNTSSGSDSSGGQQEDHESGQSGEEFKEKE